MLALLALLAGGLVVDGTLRAEARDATAIQGENSAAATVSGDFVFLQPGTDLSWRGGISPSATLAAESQLFARAFLEADLRSDDGAFIARARQAGGFGKEDLSALAGLPAQTPGQPPVVPTAPAAHYATIEESLSQFSVEYNSARRIHFDASAAWSVGGGADAASRAALPLTRGPSAQLRLTWMATHLDTLGLAIAASRSSFSTGRIASIATLVGDWSMTLDREVKLVLTAGPGVGNASGTGQPDVTSAYAVASADANVGVTREFSLVFGAAVQPLGDPASGDLIERAALRAFAAWKRTNVVSISAGLTGSVALTSGTPGLNSPEAGDRYFEGQLSASIPVNRKLEVSLGVRASNASRPLQSQPATQWGAFAGMTYLLNVIP